MLIKPVILCGGSGTRLWPTSRENYPKQFIPLFNKRSLFDLTVERVSKLKNTSMPIIICSEKHSFYIKSSLEKFNVSADLLFEPEEKNTTAAIYFSAKHSFEDDNLLIMPSDHYIPDYIKFNKTIEKICSINDFTAWITLGIKPIKASEAFGYIQTFNNNHDSLLDVKSFVEKPKLEIAKEMITKNNYFWNSGIFLGKSSMIINSIKKHAPLISQLCDNTTFTRTKNKMFNETYFDKTLFKEIISQSIDYSVMEKEDRIKLFPIDYEWNDLGSWDSISEIKSINENKDENVIEIDSKNNFIWSDNKIIATLGVEDLIIINNDNAILVAKKNTTEKVKDIVSKLHIKKFSEATEHSFEYRPWGKFENLLISDYCKVKKLQVLPYRRLSLQYHKYRSEHWLIVSGKAYIYLDGKKLILNKGQSIDIPLGSHHYIENKTSENLIVIETQLGTYFGEDDIIRIDDPYKRKT